MIVSRIMAAAMSAFAGWMAVKFALAVFSSSGEMFSAGDPFVLIFIPFIVGAVGICAMILWALCLACVSCGIYAISPSLYDKWMN